MGNSTKSGRGVILLLMIMAIILAVGVFLVIMVVSNRPTPTERMVNVNGEFVTLEVDPNLRPVIQPEALPAAEEAPPEQLPVETVVVDENQVTVEEQPTAVPPTAQPEAAAENTGTGGVGDKYVFSNYVVQAQDTLYSLAVKHNTTIALLARFGTATLIPGDTVLITTANPNYCPNRRPYIVEEGDTAFLIATRHGITVQELAEMNGHPDGNMPVYVTDVICVP